MPWVDIIFFQDSLKNFGTSHKGYQYLSVDQIARKHIEKLLVHHTIEGTVDLENREIKIQPVKLKYDERPNKQ